MNGYVYFIAPEALLHRPKHDQGRVVKIGFTKSHPSARLAKLQTGCPLPLKLWAYTPGTVELEQALHRTFADLRHLGEWFYALDKLEDLMVFLGEEPHVGHLFDEERFAGVIGDTIFTDHPPHPSIDYRTWSASTQPEHLAGFFPDEWAEWLS